MVPWRGVEIMRNILLVGGTGMLSGLATRLLGDYYHVLVIGRDPAKFAAMEREAQERVEHLTLMALDYRRLDRLGPWVAHMQLMHGGLDKVVAWIHGDAHPILEAIAGEVEQYRQSPWDLYHVLPLGASLESGATPLKMDYGRYHRIILGFMGQGEKTRWLTHPEIVDGVYAALDGGRDSQVGRISPYSQRPREV